MRFKSLRDFCGKNLAFVKETFHRNHDPIVENFYKTYKEINAIKNLKEVERKLRNFKKKIDVEKP